ncbi:DUF421 domain-containing protein [Foetidibacter luteolus]|uniref:DUF421 domain-containing protein n=1 Tax=Foetidibacter luteolus TaxID=2608880 RepID=UPI00129BB1F4|nr:YetF domain-containing protein [Foetidibacter luteolus]
MKYLIEIFGQGSNLETLQMVLRGIVIFLLTLLFLRISGRRSFGLRTPMDNIISITLGAVLSRAIVGASPFLPVVATGLVIAVLHRVFGWLVLHSNRFGGFAEGNKILLYEDGNFIDANMRRALVGKEDIMRGIRAAAMTENLEKIDRVYMERNGEITVLKKG